MDIPVVDFSAFSLQQTEAEEQQLLGLSAQIKAAFTHVGMVFLRNSGISEEEVSQEHRYCCEVGLGLDVQQTLTQDQSIYRVFLKTSISCDQQFLY